MVTRGLAKVLLPWVFWWLWMSSVVGQEGNHSIWEAVDLSKRVPAPPSLTDQEQYAKALCKGEVQLHMLQTSEPVLASLFTDHDAAFDNGWTEFYQGEGEAEQAAMNSPPKPEGRVQALLPNMLPVLDTLPEPISTETSDNPLYYWMQGREDGGITKIAYSLSLPAGQEYGKTGAWYENQMNPVGGMIICINNYGPKFWVARDPGRGKVPPLNSLSDILWLQWADACQLKGVDVGNIKYFWRHTIGDLSSVSVMNWITKMPNQSLQRWPGRTYSFADPGIDGDIAKALLGTNNGNAVGFLLAQHRGVMGKWKTVSQVQLFGGGNPRQMGRPLHLLFTVVDYVPPPAAPA